MIRVTQITQYGIYKEHVIYVDNEGYVRKILVTVIKKIIMFNKNIELI